MSNFLAIATATVTLRDLIGGSALMDVTGTLTTTGRPDPLTGTDATRPRVNIFLYQVTPNAAWRNGDLPTRNADGDLLQRPRAALDLHFLISCYGDALTLEAERLLGSVVRTLHAVPLLERQRIRDVIAAITGGAMIGFDWLNESDLAEDVELVKFTPMTLSLDELSKIWSALKLEYAPSVAYLATVVLIEGESAPIAASPVLGRKIYVTPFSQPRIDGVVAKGQPAIVASSTLVLSGRDLRGDVTKVRMFGELLAPTLVHNTTLEIPLSLVGASALRAGTSGVQVVHERLMGDPETAHVGVESEVAPFLLRPEIANPQFAAATATLPRRIIVDAAPQVAPRQRYALMLNEVGYPATRPPLAFVIEQVAGATALPSPEIDVSNVPAGTYLVRLRVDGAQSALVRDTDDTHATFNQFIGPTVVVP